jgi:predicted NAD/FAD-dependent oxidoreductase
VNRLRRGLLVAALPACGRRPASNSKLAESGFDAEVIIVGGGLAGLSAAYELKGRSVLLLEKFDRLGGRVHTERRAGVSYEVGALMAYDGRSAPSGHVPSRLIQERGRVGLTLRDKTVFGKSAPEAIALAIQDSDSSVSSGGRVAAPSSPKSQALEEAFFNLLHPGPRNEYIEERWNDWSRPVIWDHRDAGNSELVAALTRRLAATIRLGTEATAVRMRDDAVEVATGDKWLRAGLVIIATTASVASRLLGARAPAWLGSVRYASGLVVTLGLARDALEPFSHVVTPELAMNSVVSTSRDAHRVLTIYFAGKKAQSAAKLGDDDLLHAALTDLGRLGVGRIERPNLAFSDIQRWEELGTIISGEVYRNFGEGRRRPFPRVLLAGDYVQWDASKIPYGMEAALRSGRWAGTTGEQILGSRGSR